MMLTLSTAGAYFYSTMGHDQALLMGIGRLLLSGQICFIDFYEIQFPTSMFLQIFPALLERFLPISPIFAFFLWAIGVTVVSCAACFSVARRFQLFAYKEIIFLTVTVAGISLSVDFYSFGLREHLFVLAFLPFLLLRLARIEKTDFRYEVDGLIGLVTGVFVTMKPHFLIFPLLLESYVLLKTRGNYWTVLKKREFQFFVIGVAGFFLHFLLLGKDYRVSFLNFSLNHGISGYNAYNAPLSYIAKTLVNGKMLFLGGMLFYYLWTTRYSSFEKHLAAGLSLCFCGGVLIYIVQQKGWHYQALPIYFFGSLITILALRNFFRMASFLVCCGLFFFLCHNIMTSLDKKPPGVVSYLQEPSKSAKTVWFLGTGVEVPYPATLMVKKPFCGTFLWLYPLPGFYYKESFSGYHTFKEMTPLEKFVVSMLYHDLVQKQPQLIVMNQYGEQAMDTRFSLAEYLESIPPIHKILQANYDKQAVGDLWLYSFQRN